MHNVYEGGSNTTLEEADGELGYAPAGSQNTRIKIESNIKITTPNPVNSKK